jgi:hypothetical protein
MCEAPPIKRIPVKSLRFKTFEFGYKAKTKDYEIHIGRNGDEWWWDVEHKGNEIAQSDFAYKTQAQSYSIAKKRAVKALNKWRMNNE